MKDVASYGPWKAKLTSILDIEDCWEIVYGIKAEPVRIVVVNDAYSVPVN